MSEAPNETPPVRLPAGIRYVLPPWRVALYGGGVAVAFALLYGFVPAFEHVRLGLVPAFRAPYLLVPLSGLGILWSVAALLRRKRDGHARESFFALFMSVAALLMTIFAM